MQTMMSVSTLYLFPFSSYMQKKTFFRFMRECSSLIPLFPKGGSLAEGYWLAPDPVQILVLHAGVRVELGFGKGSPRLALGPGYCPAPPGVVATKKMREDSAA